jgi:hypothetical protein
MLVLETGIGGDDNGNDHSVWGAPMLVKDDGTRTPLGEYAPLDHYVGWEEIVGPAGPRVGGKLFTNSIKAHAPSRLAYVLGGEYALFEAQVGVCDSQGDRGSVTFHARAVAEPPDGTGPVSEDAAKLRGVQMLGDGDFELGVKHWEKWGGIRLVSEPEHVAEGRKALVVPRGAEGGGQWVPGVRAKGTYALTFQSKAENPGQDCYVALEGKSEDRKKTVLKHEVTVRWKEYRAATIEMQASGGTGTGIVWCWKDKKTAPMYLDDMRLVRIDHYMRELARGPAETELLRKDCASTAADDGYVLRLNVLLLLKSRCDPAKVLPRRIAAAGGSAAASPLFDRGLLAETEGSGVRTASRAGFASPSMTLAQLAEKLDAALERERPEVVRVCPDVTEIARGLSPTDFCDRLGAVVERVLEHGAIPVPYTAFVHKDLGDEMNRHVRIHNDCVRAVALSKRVPYVDAHSVLNEAGAFDQRKAPLPAGFAIVNRKFASLYAALERWVFERGRERAARSPGEVRGPRVRRGLVALYVFDEGGGDVARDSSGSGLAPELRIRHPARVRTLEGGGVALTGSTMAVSEGPASPLARRLKEAGEFTVEAWVRPANTVQGGPARIVSLSKDVTHRDFTLGQDGSKVVFRLRTTRTSGNGIPELTTSRGALSTRLTHLVCTFDGRTKRVYVDGERRPETHGPGGDLSNWVECPLIVGNEATGDRTWLGEIRLVAVYDRALGEGEVRRNFRAGCGPARAGE